MKGNDHIDNKSWTGILALHTRTHKYSLTHAQILKMHRLCTKTLSVYYEIDIYFLYTYIQYLFVFECEVEKSNLTYPPFYMVREIKLDETENT